VVRGLTQACLSQVEADKLKALRDIGKAEGLIGHEMEEHLYALDLLRERFLVNKAKTLISFPLKKLRRAR